jgi:geranylgeranyl pyrophosphate synthase
MSQQVVLGDGRVTSAGFADVARTKAPAEDAFRPGMIRVSTLLEACASRAGGLRPVIQHALAAPGKRLRARFCLAFGTVSQAEPRYSLACVEAAAAVELLHEASLIHDDVCDSSRYRRNRLSVAAAFDVRRAGWSGIYIAASALELAARVRARCGLPPNSAVLRRLCEGQLLELARGSVALVDRRAHYLRVAAAKTGGLFELACTFGAEVAGLTDDGLRAASQFATHLSVAFQVLDDVRDLEAPPDLGKPWGTDLQQGIPTWPLLEWAETRGIECLDAASIARWEPHVLRNELVTSGAVRRAREFAAAQALVARRALDPLRALPGASRIEKLSAGLAW